MTSAPCVGPVADGPVSRAALHDGLLVDHDVQLMHISYDLGTQVPPAQRLLRGDLAVEQGVRRQGKGGEMTDLLRALAVVCTIIAAVLHRAENSIVSALESAGSDSEASATLPPGLGRLGRLQLGRLRRSGALVEVSGGRYFLHPEGYKAFRAARRIRAALIFSALLVMVLVAWYLSS